MIADKGKNGFGAAGPLWITGPPPPDSSLVAAAGRLCAQRRALDHRTTAGTLNRCPNTAWARQDMRFGRACPRIERGGGNGTPN